MAAFVPNQPSTGQTIETVWGVDVHKRIYTPLACRATGLTTAGVSGGGEIACSLDAVSHGYNMLDTATDKLIIPAGGAGLYMCNAAVRVGNMTTGAGNFVRFRFTVSGAVQPEATVVLGMTSASMWGTITWIGALSDASTIGVNALPHATVAADVQVQAMVLTRIANGYGNTPARSLAEVLNPLPAPPLILPRKRGK